MAIRKRGSGHQIDVAVKGKRWRGQARTLDEALILEARVKADLLAGKPVSVNGTAGPAPTTLGQVHKRTCDRVWAGSKGERTALINAQSAVDFFGPDYPISRPGLSPCSKPCWSTATTSRSA